MWDKTDETNSTKGEGIHSRDGTNCYILNKSLGKNNENKIEKVTTHPLPSFQGIPNLDLWNMEYFV